MPACLSDWARLIDARVLRRGGGRTTVWPDSSLAGEGPRGGAARDFALVVMPGGAPAEASGVGEEAGEGPARLFLPFPVRLAPATGEAGLCAGVARA